MENEGRVEYCSSRRWGLVCYDSWDTSDAKVICHQLGYNVESELLALVVHLLKNLLYVLDGIALANDRPIGRNPPPVHLLEVNCVGTEGDINECPRDDTHVCLNSGAGVICPKGNYSV